MNLNNLYCLFLLSLFTAVAGNWKPGTGDRILLPSSDCPITSDANAFNPANGYRVNSSDANTRDYLANISTTHPMFKNKFLLFGDSLLFEVVGACDNSSASCATFLTNRTASDRSIDSPDKIDDLASKFAAVGVRDAVIVLSFGFDDIRFSTGKCQTEIGYHLVNALERMARKLQSRGLQIWFLTIPEIGDLAPKFKEFNDFFRKHSKNGILPFTTILDFSKIALSNESANVRERFSMLMSFFEQKLNKRLLSTDPRPMYANPNVLKSPYRFVTNNSPEEEETPVVKYVQVPQPCHSELGFCSKVMIIISVVFNVLFLSFCTANARNDIEN